METMTNRQKQAIATRRRIFETAMQLFAEKGFEEVPITEICKACDISVGGFYHHFKTKYDILDEGYRLFDLEISETFEKECPSSPIAALYFLVEKQTESVELLGYKAFSQYLNNQLSTDHKFILEESRFFTKSIESCVQSALSNESLQGDASGISEEILSATRGLIYDWCLHEGKYSLKKRSLNITKMILSFYENK